jgi:hypothetical protein
VHLLVAGLRGDIDDLDPDLFAEEDPRIDLVRQLVAKDRAVQRVEIALFPVSQLDEVLKTLVLELYIISDCLIEDKDMDLLLFDFIICERVDTLFHVGKGGPVGSWPDQYILRLLEVPVVAVHPLVRGRVACHFGFYLSRYGFRQT